MQKIDLDALECEYENLFSQKINAVLEYRGITIKTLAGHIGKAANTVSNWKYKRSYPTGPDLKNMALACEMDILYFFDSAMTPEQGDLKLKKHFNSETYTIVQSMLFPNMKSFTKERLDLAEKVMNMTEKDVLMFLNLISVVKEG